MIRSFFRRFNHDTSGSILMITGLSFIVLFVIGGAGYDLGKQQLVKQRIQQSADAAALAAAGMEDGTSEDARRATANAFFEMNYGREYLGVGRPLPQVNIDSSARGQVEVSGLAGVPTSFVGNIGISQLDALGRSVVQIGNAATKIDLILVMDNSGSMAANDVGGSGLDGDLAQMQQACITAMSSPQHIASLRAISIAANPDWAETYRNLPDSYFDLSIACRPPYTKTFDGGHTNTYNWGYTGPNRLTALRYIADNAAQELISPNPLEHRIALVKWNNVLIGSHDFSADYATVSAALKTMFAGEHTDSTAGLTRALAMIDAQARPDTARVVVLMTDGENHPANTVVQKNEASVALCEQIKSRQRTAIYTIAFGSVVDDPVAGPRTKQFLSDCASGEHGTSDPKPNEATVPPRAGSYFYAAPDAEALANAFEDIIQKAKNLRIVQ